MDQDLPEIMFGVADANPAMLCKEIVVALVVEVVVTLANKAARPRIRIWQHIRSPRPRGGQPRPQSGLIKAFLRPG